MTRTGGALALLLLAAAPSFAQVADAAWPPALPALPILAPALRPPVPFPAAAAAVPTVSFHGVVIKGVQFSRTDRVPASLVAAIDATQRTLLLAIYDLRLPDVAAAIVRAKGRGVDVRMVYDEGHAAPADPSGNGGPSAEFQSVVDAGVPVRLLKGGGSYGIMHNKFAVFDGELVETGSFNWTAAADAKNFENSIWRSDPAYAAGFARYWDWMWGLAHAPGIAAAPVAGAGFGTPPGDASRPVAFNGGAYPRWSFSPQGGVEDLLVDAIGRARSTVDVAIFSLYSQRVADALIAAKGRGVAVRVVADASQSRRAQPVAALAAAGVALRISGGRDGGTGVFHHKYAIVDGTLLITGSYNFSQNAELYNFENDLYTTVPAEAAAFGGEFAADWTQARVPSAGDLPAPKNL